MNKLIIAFILLPIFIQAQDYSKLSHDLVKMHIENQNREDVNLTGEIHMLIKGNGEKLSAFVESHNGIVKYRYGRILAIRLPLNVLSSLSELDYLEKAEIHNQALYFNDAVAIAQTSVDTVHAGGGLLKQPYTGKGVIFGMIDSGIDPTHIDFKNDDGSTRIVAFWNQNDTLSSLFPYGYGKEYTRQDIDNGLMSAYLDTVYNGHGSAVAGFAAGGGRARKDIMGFAPDCEIIAVGINPSVLDYLDRTPSMLNIVDGIDYIFTIADSLNRPAVINISLGGLEGSHDGRDLPTQLIDAMLEAKSGRSLVTSAGNSANTRHHIQFLVSGDTLFTWFESMYSNSEVCKRDSGAYMSFYGDSIDVVNLRYSISAEEQSPCCTILDETNYKPYMQPVGQINYDTLRLGTNILGYVSTFMEKIENTYAFFMEIRSDSMDLLWRYNVTGSGKIDGWAGPLTARSCNSTYIEFPSRIGNSTQIKNFANYVQPDYKQTIGTAYASSKNAITVGAHYVRNSMRDVDSVKRNYFVTPLLRASFSSFGPSRDGRIKPDIMAPGSRIITTQASQVLAQKAINGRSTLYLGGQHSITDGTSFASPAVAGIVALYFEKNPNATFREVITAMQLTADEDPFMLTLPNNSYGYGRINGYQMLLGPWLGVKSYGFLEALIYPNPNKGEFTVRLSDDNPSALYQVKLLDMTGRIIYQGTEKKNLFSVSVEQKGFFIIQIQDENGNIFSNKLIIE